MVTADSNTARLYWRRKGGKATPLPGRYTKKQKEALMSMLNISNWFMDVEIWQGKWKE